MHVLRNTLLSVAGTASLVLSPMLLAEPAEEQKPPMGQQKMPMGEHKGPMGENCPMMTGASPQQAARIQKFHEERVKALEEALKPKPEQQAAWKAFVAAQEAHHKDMTKPFEKPAADASALVVMETRVKAVEQNLTSLKAAAKALGDLYPLLDADQKKVIDKFCTEQPKRGMRARLAPAAPNPPAAPPTTSAP